MSMSPRWEPDRLDTGQPPQRRLDLLPSPWVHRAGQPAPDARPLLDHF